MESVLVFPDKENWCISKQNPCVNVNKQSIWHGYCTPGSQLLLLITEHQWCIYLSEWDYIALDVKSSCLWVGIVRFLQNNFKLYCTFLNLVKTLKKYKKIGDACFESNVFRCYNPIGLLTRITQRRRLLKSPSQPGCVTSSGEKTSCSAQTRMSDSQQQYKLQMLGYRQLRNCPLKQLDVTPTQTKPRSR